MAVNKRRVDACRTAPKPGKTSLVAVFLPVTPAGTPLKGKKEKESFRSKGSEEGQAASLADTAGSDQTG